MEKYKMWDIIIRDRKGIEHFLKYDMNTTVATLVKREDASKDFSGVFIGDYIDNDYPRLEEINEVSVK